MKFLLITALVAVATAVPTKRVNPIAIGPAIIDGPSVGPAIIGAGDIAVGPAIVDFPLPDGGAASAPVDISPISVGPAIVESGDIAVGPAIIDFPLPDGGAVSAPVEISPVGVAPVVVGPVTSESSPLVQIIINVNAPAGVGPVVDAVADTPVNIIDVMPVVDETVDAVQVVDTAIVVDPVQVVDTPMVVDPVHVVDVAPVAIGTPILPAPIIPAPAITLPEELN